jgi:tRNA modification GTPase
VLATTIYAIASPPGQSPRAVLRLSGPSALAAAELVFAPALPAVRAQVEGHVRVRNRSVRALALVMPGPRSYTGEDTVELHVPGSPLLLGELAAEFARHSSSLALVSAAPGEFTRRAFVHGRIDLAQAEGVLLLIHGEAEDAQRLGLQWLQGGLSQAIAAVRSDLQDASALVAAGLDFTDGETGEVPDPLWRAPLLRGIERMEQVLADLPAALPSGEVLLLGAANAGKSSLCNALAGRDAVLVDSVPGTTRDLVRVELARGVALWDAPGDLTDPEDADRAALALRDRLGQRAACALLVLDPAAPHVPTTRLPILAVVVSKQDLMAPADAERPLPTNWSGLPQFLVSARTGAGIDALRQFLLARGGAGAGAACAPLRERIQQACAAARSALTAPLGELAGADLELALQELGAIDGSHSPEDLLDRIFSRFCLGK